MNVIDIKKEALTEMYNFLRDRELITEAAKYADVARNTVLGVLKPTGSRINTKVFNKIFEFIELRKAEESNLKTLSERIIKQSSAAENEIFLNK